MFWVSAMWKTDIPSPMSKGRVFIVHLPDRDIELKKRGKLFCGSLGRSRYHFEDCAGSWVVLFKAEINRAKEAHDFIRNSGYPSMDILIHLIEHGNILELPSILWADIKRAYDIYGLPVENVRGKLAKKKAGRQSFEPALQWSEREQVLFFVVKHINHTH